MNIKLKEHECRNCGAWKSSQDTFCSVGCHDDFHFMRGLIIFTIILLFVVAIVAAS